MIEECQTIQILEPDGDLPVGIPGSSDPALTERGDVILQDGQTQVVVNFVAIKLNATYRFEYLYVDSFGAVAPGVINAVPVLQTTAGFTADLAGAPIGNGYILRWRVVVIVTALPPPSPTPDAPENVYVNLPMSQVFTYYFQSPRSITTYTFSELRVEWTGGFSFGAPVAIFPMVIARNLLSFTVWLNTIPADGNYYLVARIP
jgi:hypothetical protein